MLEPAKRCWEPISDSCSDGEGDPVPLTGRRSSIVQPNSEELTDS